MTLMKKIKMKHIRTPKSTRNLIKSPQKIEGFQDETRQSSNRHLKSNENPIHRIGNQSNERINANQIPRKD